MKSQQRAAIQDITGKALDEIRALFRLKVGDHVMLTWSVKQNGRKTGETSMWAPMPPAVERRLKRALRMGRKP